MATKQKTGKQHSPMVPPYVYKIPLGYRLDPRCDFRVGYTSDPLRFTADIAVMVEVGLLGAIPVLCKEVGLSRLYSATFGVQGNFCSIRNLKQFFLFWQLIKKINDYIKTSICANFFNASQAYYLILKWFSSLIYFS